MLDYRESADVGELRSVLRELIGAHIPESFLGAFTNDPADFELTEEFSRMLGKKNLLARAWPAEFGGGNANVWEQAAVREEMWAAHEPRGAQYMGVNWVGPMLMKHGNAEQRTEHLPPIARGEVVWCQGFSEPEAGSDLPGLRTSATRVEGGWVINGQKVWTSYARMAQWCFLLARTGSPQDRKAGITVFLLPMDSPGIEVRRIGCLMGEHHLNEMYFDDVQVPDSAVLGEVNGGWDIVLDVLGHERVGIARYARIERLLGAAPKHLGDTWQELPTSLRERWVAALARARQARLLAYNILSKDGTGSITAFDTASYRMVVTTLDQEASEIMMEILGNSGLGPGAENDQFAREVEDFWRYSQSATVASGTLEMNKHAIARTLENR